MEEQNWPFLTDFSAIVIESSIWSLPLFYQFVLPALSHTLVEADNNMPSLFAERKTHSQLLAHGDSYIIYPSLLARG